MMKQTYATPAHVGTNVRSVTQSLFGAVAVQKNVRDIALLGDAHDGRAPAVEG